MEQSELGYHFTELGFFVLSDLFQVGDRVKETIREQVCYSMLKSNKIEQILHFIECNIVSKI